MKFDNSRLEDYLLPDIDTLNEFMFDEEEELISNYNSEESDGIFSDSPEDVAMWIEKASENFYYDN